MLIQLSIHNIAIVDHLTVEFSEGLNILTGETGAGKSIIIGAIGAVMGERMNREVIRTGCDKALVEAVFQSDNEELNKMLEDSGIDQEEDGTLIIAREVTATGKSSCRINGRMVTVSTLREISRYLLDIHGQYDNQSLLYSEIQMKLLDCFGGKDIEALKARYSHLLEQYRSIKKQIRELSGDTRERERKMDLLKFQTEEISKAKLKSGEDIEIEKERKILSNSEKLLSSLADIYELLQTGSKGKISAIDGINQAVQDLKELIKIDDSYEELHNSLEAVYYQLEDVVVNIRDKRDAVEYNPNRLEEIDERLDLIVRLKKKYGSTIEDIIQYCESLESELETLENSEEKVNKLSAEAEQIESELLCTAAEISKLRKSAAELLESKIEAELDDLEMKKAKFKAMVEFNGEKQPGENEWGSTAGSYKFNAEGMDKVEFLISVNSGEPLKPLSKVASGGEMSRIMLAIKTILADVDEVPTLIFDEIDIGISGKAAQKVGEKMLRISRGHQVICVTHLAQIACMADAHYLIEKNITENSTKTYVKRMDREESIKEIARILGGSNVTELTLKLAESMIRQSIA